MSFWSSLGSVMSSASGSGVLGSWDGGWSTYSSGQSRTKYAAKKAYEMQQKAALEMPAITREGLVRAGINPLLATSAFGSSSAGSSSFFDAPSGGSALSFDGLKGFLGKEKKEMAQNEVEKGKETNDLIREQRENVKEETRGKKIDNDLKGIKTAIGAATAAGAVAGGSALAYRNIKSVLPKKIDDGGWNALRAAKVGSHSAKAASIGSRFLGRLGLGLPALLGGVAVDAFLSPKGQELYHKGDTKKYDRWLQHGNYSR